MYTSRKDIRTYQNIPNAQSILIVVQPSISQTFMHDNKGFYQRDSYLSEHPEILTQGNSSVQSYLNGLRSEIRNNISPFTFEKDSHNFDLISLFSRNTDANSIKDYFYNNLELKRQFINENYNLFNPK